jgi:hypothetical protein
VRRKESLIIGAFLALVAVLAIGLTVRSVGAPPARPSIAGGCQDAVPAAALTFCLQLDAVPKDGEGVAGAVGILDQLPACGARTGMAPSFCVDLATTAPARTGSPGASASTGGESCREAARGDAPIFCLATVAAAGPEGRQAMIAHLAERGGLNTRSLDLPGVHLQLDRLIGPADAERLRSTVTADLAAVESYFERAFETPPTIFVLATPSGYADALRELLGYTPANAAALSLQSGGLYVRDPSVVFVNWSYRGRGPLLVMRHELTHVMVREIVGRETTTTPAWIDEGLATLVQNAARPASTSPDMAAPIALALLAQQHVTLDDLDSLAQWPARNGALGGYAYDVAEKGLRELLRHVPLPALLRIFTAQRSGASFSDAYAQIAGEPYAAFLESFARRVAACAPVIAVGSLRASGDLSYLASGFRPKQKVRVTISGPAYQLGFDVETDTHGLYAGTFGSTAIPGLYEIRASDGTASSPKVTLDTRATAPNVADAPDVCGN